MKTNLLNKNFVPYGLALELKNLGFELPCFGWYVSEHYGLEIGYVEKDDLIREAILAPFYQDVFDWFEEHFGLYIEWSIDGWGTDECVSKENICYRLFIWEVGKPKPHHNSDLGAGSRAQMNPVGLKDLIEIAKNGPDWDSLDNFPNDEL